MQPILTFVHISDSHLGPTRDYELYGYRSLDTLARVVALINDFPQPPDFVLHSGDVSQDRSPESYALAAEVLAQLHVPVYYVNGNHDTPALLRSCLNAPQHTSGDPAAPLEYTFEVNGERFVVLDAYDESVEQPAGYMNADRLAFARTEVQRGTQPLTVLLHYAPFPMASPWLDARMIIRNGDDLHQILLPVRDRLRGVFHGHLHRSSQVRRDGITYTCAPSTVVQYGWRPWDDLPQADHLSPPGYNVVQYFSDQVIVHQYAFPRE